MQAAGEAMGMTESPLESVQAEGKKSAMFMVRWRKPLWVKLVRGQKKVGHENQRRVSGKKEWSTVIDAVKSENRRSNVNN